MTDKDVLSTRAKYRLRLVAATLRSRGHKLDFPRNEFYVRIQETIANLSADEQTNLKKVIDWTECYEMAEAKYFGPAPKSTEDF